MSPYSVDHRTFSLDDFQQLVTDAFNTPAHPLLLASPVANPNVLASTEPSGDPSDDEHHPHPTDGRDHTPPSDSDEDASNYPDSPQSHHNTRRRTCTGHLRERSSASFAPTSTMQFSAPSPSPTLLIRRRLDSLLDPNSVLPLSPPPTTSTSGFSGATVAMNEPNAKQGGSGGFFRTLKTRASHLLLRAAHPSSSKPRTTTVETASSEPTKEVVDSTHPPVRVHDSHHQSPFDENYSFPPRVDTSTLTVPLPPNEIDAVFSSPISPIHPHDHFPHVNASSSTTSLCFPCPPLLTPLTPVSPPRNIKPGRYATSPKGVPLPSTSKGPGTRTPAHLHHKDGDVNVTPEDKDKEKERERELSRRLVQMGLAQHAHAREWSRDSGHGLGMGQVLGEMKGRRGGVHIYGRGHRHEYGRIGEEGGERGERKKGGVRRTHSDSVPLDVLLSKDHGQEDGQTEGQVEGRGIRETGMVTPPESPEHSRFPLVNVESNTIGRARRGAIDASVAFLEPSFEPKVSFSRDHGELVARDYADERVGIDAESSQRLGVQEVRRRSASDASMVHESPSSIYPQSPHHETPTTHTIQRTARRRRSTSDASITPLRSSFSPPSPHSPDNVVPPLPKEIARRLKFTRRVDSREEARVKAVIRPVLGEANPGSQANVGVGPSTPPRIRIHTRLPPLNTIRANYFSHQHSYEPLNGQSEMGTYKFGGDASTNLRTTDDEPEDDRAGVYSLGLGIEFLEGELGERCPSPYVNPRPAPVPPPRGADMEEEEELQVPGYVFERRGSAASGCTTSSARSTKTLKERISSFVPSVPHMPSLWSLKQNSFSRSKLNVTLSAMPPSPSSSFEPTPTASPFAASTSTSPFTPSTSNSSFTPSTSTSPPVHVRIHPPPLSPHTSPHAKSTRSYTSNNTTFTRSTNESSELLATPRTPGSGMYYQHSHGYHPQSSPYLAPSSFAGPSTQPGTPSSPPRLGKRTSYTSRLYASRNRSELSLALGMGLGLGASGMSRTSCMDEEGLGDETELEARAIGRVLTPEVDPFMRLPIERAVSVLPGRRELRRDNGEGRSRLAESEESLSVVGEDTDTSVTVESASASDASHSTALHEGSVAASLSAGSSPRSSRRTRGRGASFLRSSLEDCRSPPPPYSPPPPPPGPSPYLHPQFVQSTFSESSSSNLSFVTSEDTCPLPDSPVLPPSPLPSVQPPPPSSSSAPVLSPLSPVSELSFSFPLP